MADRIRPPQLARAFAGPRRAGRPARSVAHRAPPSGVNASLRSPRHRVLFETLEPRYLLSADLMPFVVDMADVGEDLTLRLDRDSNVLQLFDNAHGNAPVVVSEQALDRTSAVVVKGSDRDDTLTIDYVTPFSLTGGISFQAGLGGDSLLIRNGRFDSVAFDIIASHAGTIGLSGDGGFGSIAYEDLEHTDDSVGAGSRAIKLGDAVDRLTLSDDIAGKRSKAAVTSGQSITFSRSQDALTIDAGGGALVNQGRLVAEDVVLAGQRVSNSGAIEARSNAQGGGRIRIEALEIASDGTITAQGGGDIVLSAGRAGTLDLGGRIDASGDGHGRAGGTVQLLGQSVSLQDGATIDASGALGGGSVLIGGGGPADGALAARHVVVGGNALIDVSARGGGDGGMVRISSTEHSDLAGRVDTAADAGTAGTLVLEGRRVVVAAGAADDGSDRAALMVARSMLEDQAGSMVIRAAEDIVIEDLWGAASAGRPGDGILDLAAADGATIVFAADTDGDGDGAIRFADTSNTIRIGDGDIRLTGAGLELADIDAGSGAVEIESAGSLTLRDIRAGALDVTAGGVLDQATGSALIIAGRTTLAADSDIILDQENDFSGLVTVIRAADVTLRDVNAILLGPIAHSGRLTVIAAEIIWATDPEPPAIALAGGADHAPTRRSGADVGRSMGAASAPAPDGGELPAGFRSDLGAPRGPGETAPDGTDPLAVPGWTVFGALGVMPVDGAGGGRGGVGEGLAAAGDGPAEGDDAQQSRRFDAAAQTGLGSVALAGLSGRVRPDNRAKKERAANIRDGSARAAAARTPERGPDATAPAVRAEDPTATYLLTGMRMVPAHPRGAGTPSTEPAPAALFDGSEGTLLPQSDARLMRRLGLSIDDARQAGGDDRSWIIDHAALGGPTDEDLGADEAPVEVETPAPEPGSDGFRDLSDSWILANGRAAEFPVDWHGRFSGFRVAGGTGPFERPM